MMGQSMKVIGDTIKHMAVVNFCMLMVIYLRDNGLMTKLMGMGSIVIKMELNIWVIGKMIFRMVLEEKFGLIKVLMKVIM